MPGLPAPLVLIVEDNPSTRRIVRITLNQHGWDVLEAGDGASALELIRQPPTPGLIVQDLVLPDMSGFDLVRRMRSLPQTAETPILAFTGFLTRSDEAHMLAAGFNGVLIKPVEPSRLIVELEPYLAVEPEGGPGGPRVVLIDDDPIQLKAARRQLVRHGFDVVAVSSGPAALDVLRNDPPAAVVSDVLMPDMDGFELAARVRTDPLTKQVPVLLLTNYFVHAEDRELALRLGAQDMIVRATTLDDVAARLRALIGVAPEPVAEMGRFSEIQRSYLKRMNAQLLRQVEVNAGLSQRVSLMSTSLSVLGSIAGMLNAGAQAELATADVLALCVDAAGLSRGALFLQDEESRWRCAAQVGFDAVDPAQIDSLFGYAALLDAALPAGACALTSTDSDPGVQMVLARCGASSALLASVDGLAVERGVLMLVASTTDVRGGEWLGFARAIAGQLGQALALSRAIRTLAQSDRQHRMLVGRYRALMEKANDGVSVLSLDGVVLETNKRWSEILGQPIDAIIGRHIGSFVAGHQELERFVQAVHAGAATVKGVGVRRSDGSVRTLDISLGTVDLGDHAVLITIARDMTHETLLERQLRQSQKMEAIGRLAGGVAHDFNNVLTTIQGSAQFALDALPGASDVRVDLEEVLRASERAAALTKQLLAFSRKQVLSPRILDVADLVRGTERMLGRLIGEDVRLTTTLHPDTGRVNVDAGQLEQVVMNLVVNARDAMPFGGQLTIETRSVELDETYVQDHPDVAPGPYVQLSVTDTGIGMSDEVQTRIFEPFFTTKETGKGTGLGLATVFGIVEQSGGFIWVDSEVGIGTTFKVYLPRVAHKGEEVKAPEPALSARGSETVLVAEDDAAVRRLLVRSLEQLGYTVHAAADAEEALRIASGLSAPADLLVTDVVMPGTSGRVLAERLSERWPGLRVLYTSGYTDDAIVHHGVLEAGVAFLQKPYTPAAVAEKVREVLDR